MSTATISSKLASSPTHYPTSTTDSKTTFSVIPSQVSWPAQSQPVRLLIIHLLMINLTKYAHPTAITAPADVLRARLMSAVRPLLLFLLPSQLIPSYRHQTNPPFKSSVKLYGMMAPGSSLKDGHPPSCASAPTRC